MREIDKLIFHCSATIEGQITFLQLSKGGICKDRGWSDIGYHYI